MIIKGMRQYGKQMVEVNTTDECIRALKKDKKGDWIFFNEVR